MILRSAFDQQQAIALIVCCAIAALWAVFRPDMVRDPYGRKLGSSFIARLTFTVGFVILYLSLALAFYFGGAFLRQVSSAVGSNFFQNFYDQTPLLALITTFGLYSFEPFRQIEQALLSWMHRSARRQMKEGVFISYRRGDDSGVAGRLRDHLANRIPEAPVFMDVDSMRPGTDFVQELDDQVARAKIFLVLVGAGWADARNSNGAKRLEDENDFVRLEVGSALKQQKLVVPVLVNGAHMPTADQLPEDLKPLVRRSAIELRHTRFGVDADEIAKEARSRLGLRPQLLPSSH